MNITQLHKSIKVLARNLKVNYPEYTFKVESYPVGKGYGHLGHNSCVYLLILGEGGFSEEYEFVANKKYGSGGFHTFHTVDGVKAAKLRFYSRFKSDLEFNKSFPKKEKIKRSPRSPFDITL